MNENLLYPRRIMNFAHTGCSLIPFAHTVFGPKAPLENRKNGLEYAKRHLPAFLGVSSNFENIVFTTALNYPEYDKLREKLLSFYKTHLTIAKPPEILLFPVEDLYYFKKLSFHQLLEEMPGMEDK